MGIEFDTKITKITWTIEEFSSLPPDKIFSDPFIVGGCKWNLEAYPKGKDNTTHLALFLCLVNCKSRPSGWRIHTKYRLVVVNQVLEKLSKSREVDHWFDKTCIDWGFPSMCLLNEINAKDSGFLLNGELKIFVEIEVLEVIGKLDFAMETSRLAKDVHGFILLPSQAKYVSRILERHPEIVSDFRTKNPDIRTGYMSLLLGLIETTCQLPQQISKDDLFDAYDALRSLKDAGFKLDWLEKKLDEVSENIENSKSIEAGVQEMEEELKDLDQKRSDMKDLVEKEKTKLLALKAPISFDDILD